MNTNKLVSCVIPSYKRNDTITRAIDSVLTQTYSNIEVIIVDDNERGDVYSITLKDIVKSYNNDRVKLLLQPKHINGAAARNFGIQHANGDYIAFLDDDDEWEPTKIEKQVTFLQNNKDFDGVAVLSSVYKANQLVFHQKPFNTDNLQFKVFLRKAGMPTSVFLAKKKCLLSMGGFDENLIRHQDLQLYISFLEMYKIGLIPENLVKRHADSEINRPNTEKLIRIKKDYFNSVSKSLEKYSLKDTQRIFCNHNFEVAYIAFKEHKFILGIKYLFKSRITMAAIKDLYERIRQR